MLQNCDAFGNAPRRIARSGVITPGRSNAECVFLGGLALGIDKRAAGLDTQLRYNASGKQRVICLEDTNVCQGFQGNLEIYKSKLFVRRTDCDSTYVTDDWFLARLYD